MELRKLLAAGAAATTLFAAGAADAAIVFVGSWQLNAGADHTTVQSAQQVAAKLFGGDAADYLISSFSSDVGSIDEKAWYVPVGSPGDLTLDDQDATEFVPGVGLSAYADDPLIEDRWVNYAFRDDGNVGGIPEPATWALMIGGFGLAGAALRRPRADVA